MASIDDVYRDVTMLLDALVRTAPDGVTPGMGQVGTFPGMVPRTYRVAERANDSVARTLTTATETAALLKAVNEVTLGRMEAGTNGIGQTVGRVEAAVNDSRTSNEQALGRIEAVLNDVMQFLPTVRADTTDLSARIDIIVAEQQQLTAGLHAKLDSLIAEVQSLPH